MKFAMKIFFFGILALAALGLRPALALQPGPMEPEIMLFKLEGDDYLKATAEGSMELRFTRNGAIHGAETVNANEVEKLGVYLTPKNNFNPQKVYFAVTSKEDNRRVLDFSGYDANVHDLYLEIHRPEGVKETILLNPEAPVITLTAKTFLAVVAGEDKTFLQEVGVEVPFSMDGTLRIQTNTTPVQASVDFNPATPDKTQDLGQDSSGAMGNGTGWTCSLNPETIYVVPVKDGVWFLGLGVLWTLRQFSKSRKARRR